MSIQMNLDGPTKTHLNFFQELQEILDWGPADSWLGFVGKDEEWALNSPGLCLCGCILTRWVSDGAGLPNSPQIGLFETNRVDKHSQMDVMMIFIAAEETTLRVPLAW